MSRYIAYQRERREHYQALNKANRLKIRKELLSAYGGKCACCGESRHIFLTIDKIDNGHAAWCRSLGIAMNQTAYKLREWGYPPGWQVLCMNCNYAKQHHGNRVQCPCGTLLAVGDDVTTPSGEQERGQG